MWRGEPRYPGFSSLALAHFSKACCVNRSGSIWLCLHLYNSGQGKAVSYYSPSPPPAAGPALVGHVQPGLWDITGWGSQQTQGHWPVGQLPAVGTHCPVCLTWSWPWSSNSLDNNLPAKRALLCRGLGTSGLQLPQGLVAVETWGWGEKGLHCGRSSPDTLRGGQKVLGHCWFG